MGKDKFIRNSMGGNYRVDESLTTPQIINKGMLLNTVIAYELKIKSMAEWNDLIKNGYHNYYYCYMPNDKKNFCRPVLPPSKDCEYKLQMAFSEVMNNKKEYLMENFDGVINEIIADELGVKLSDVTDEKNLYLDLGADSLDMVSIDINIQGEFDIEIEDDEIKKEMTASKLKEIVRKKLN